MARVIDQVLGATTSSVVGEITRELVNASDGAGLHFDGAAGNVSGTSNLALGSKYSAEFVINYTGSANNRLFDINGDTRFIVEFNRSGFSGKIAGYDSDFYEICDIPDDGVFHLVVTVDGTAVSAYVNGNLAGTATKNNSTSIDTVTQWTIGANDGGSFGHFEGTIYRARFYNRTLSADDVRTAYERADVDYSSQYGSQTSLVDAGASVFTSGTYSWVAYGSNTIANVGNALEITYGNAANGAYNYFRNASDLTTDLIVGKKYRLTVDAKYTGGSAGSTLVIGSVGTAFATLTTSMVTYTTEFTATQATTDNLRCGGMSAGNVVTIDNWYLREIGAVSDYDLAFANPTQSLTVQDRAGLADGTCSASGVTQVQPVVQGNLTSLAVSSATARTPADGAITCEDVLVNTDSHFTTGGTPKVSINTTANALSFGFSDEIAYIRKQSGAVFQWQTSDSGSNAGEIQLQPYGGSVGVGNTAPSAPLEVSKSAASTVAAISTFSETDADHSVLQLKKSGSATVGTKAVTADGEILGRIDAYGVDTNSNQRRGAQIEFNQAAAATGSKVAGNIVFKTSSTSANDVTALTIDSTGLTTAKDLLVADGSNDVAVALGNSGYGMALDYSSGDLSFKTNTVNRLTVSNTGLATFSGGIAFSQTNSSTAGSILTTLDHYEQGHFTATLNGGTAEPATLVTSNANYTRVGDRVFFSIGFENADTTGYSGAITISGLPFANAGVVRAPISVITYDSATWTTGSQAAAFVGRNHSYVSMYAFSSGGVWNALQHDAGTGRYFWLNGTYRTAAA